MWKLKQIAYKDIEQYDSDYCRRSNDPTVPEDCHFYGVFHNADLVGYFAVSDGADDGLFIRRGFVCSQFRSTATVRTIGLKLLEQAAKEQGYRNIEFESTRNPAAYIRLFKQHGYKPRYIGFRKYI